MRPYFEELSERIRVSPSPAREFPEHLHTQVEMLYVFEGAATMLVDGQIHRLLPGDLCVCFPGVVHGYQEPAGARALMLIFAPEMFPEFDGVMSRTCPENPVIRREQLAEDVPLCMKQLLLETTGGKDEGVLRGYIQVVLARTIPKMPLLNRAPEVADIVYGILKYLSGHFTEPLTLGDLSRALGVSKSHLSHTFSERIGTNFRTYINTLRVDQARLLLRSTDRSITEIAYECGFETQRTFNRVFLQRYGTTPSEYRQSLEGKKTQ